MKTRRTVAGTVRPHNGVAAVREAGYAVPGNRKKITRSSVRFWPFVIAGALALTVLPGAVAAPAQAAVDEQEPNDSFETANAISLKETVYATFDGGNYNYDYFKVALPQNGAISFKIKNDQRSDRGYMSFSIFDQYYDEEYRSNTYWCQTTTPATLTYSLKRGTHYLRVYNNSALAGIPYHFKFSYVIPGTSLKKVTAAKKAFTAKWVKKSGSAYYQVRYTPVATYKLYGWDKAKIVKASRNKVSLKVKGLESKKKYYAQVRVAKTIDGKNYLSSWSGKKSVETQ